MKQPCVAQRFGTPNQRNVPKFRIIFAVYDITLPS